MLGESGHPAGEIELNVALTGARLEWEAAQSAAIQRVLPDWALQCGYRAGLEAGGNARV